MTKEFLGGRDAAQKRYREKNKDKRNAKKREHYAANKDAIRKKQSEYRKNNPETVNSANARWRAEFWPALRAEMIDAYGGSCSCCGEAEPKFLDLDHINNDGNACRKAHKNGQQEVLALKRSGWPKEKHQLLCCNCNQGKARNKGVCPHKQKDQS